MTSRSTKRKLSPIDEPDPNTMDKPVPYTLEKKELVRNGKNVFELNQGRCSFIVDDSFDYYVYKNDNNLPVIVPMIPSQTRGINAINKNLTESMTTTQKIKGVNALFLSSCRPRMNLSEAQQRLDTLIPHFPCKDLDGTRSESEVWESDSGATRRNLTIRLDHVYNFPDETPMLLVYKKESWWSDRYYDSIVLTLNRGNRCVSSVVLKPTADDSVLEITSMTRKEEERKSYNKLLLSVAVYVASGLPGITQLKSVAIHPASAWSLIKSYQLTKHYDYTRESIKELFENNVTMDLYVPLNKFNMAKALEEFQTVQCTTGGKRTRKYRLILPK